MSESEPLTAEIAAIEAYRQKHSKCNIQQHPWQAIFGAAFDAGRDWQREHGQSEQVAALAAALEAQRDVEEAAVNAASPHSALRSYHEGRCEAFSALLAALAAPAAPKVEGEG